MASLILCSLLKDFSFKCAHFLEQKIQNVHPGSCAGILTAIDTIGRLYRHSCVPDNTHGVQAASKPRWMGPTKRLLLAFLWIPQTDRCRTILTQVPVLAPRKCAQRQPRSHLTRQGPEESGQLLIGSPAGEHDHYNINLGWIISEKSPKVRQMEPAKK